MKVYTLTEFFAAHKDLNSRRIFAELKVVTRDLLHLLQLLFLR